jgi:glyoxylase-like metal-dependent hydrolase (beta-lactamase superfamily II)
MRDDMATSEGKSSGSGAPDVTDLGDNVFQIDTRMAGYPGITAGYLIRGSRPCLVETGTAWSAPIVRDALAALGVGAADLATVVVTHIHLDHAGGVGDIAAMYPAAEIVVHQKGARHLADPSRLMASARLVYGDALDVLFGALAPVPADRIRSLDDVGTVDLGDGRRLDSHYSPGHAKHHVGLIDSASGDLYVGDAAGVYIPDTGDLRPATPPPDFDLDTALASLRKFEALRPSRLLFSHYGPVNDVAAILERSAEEISVWVESTRNARSAGMDLDHAIAMVREQTLSRYIALRPDADPAIATKFERISSAAANVAGIWHWLDKLDAPASLRVCFAGVAGHASGAFGAYGTVPSVPMDDLPDWLPAWCLDHLGGEPAGVLFQLRQVSMVFGLRLAGGRDVVVKARADDGRAVSCVAAQARLAERGFPCARPLTPVVVAGPLAVHAEEFRPGGEVLHGNTPDITERYAQVFAKLMTELADVTVAPPLPNPPWVRWDHADTGVWPSIDFLDSADQSDVPAYVVETAERARGRLLTANLPCLLGYADFEAQNLRWLGRELWAVHDWDSLAWQPEAALAGAASGSFASAGPPMLAPIESSEAFLVAYQDIRGRVFTAAELRVAWAASLWMAAYNAREEALLGHTLVCRETLRAQAAERLRRADA